MLSIPRGQSIRSEPATALRERLTRYKDKLFTFIKHESVPWNNNNAEYAIKQFVYYREHTDGFMSENGLRDYLVLQETSNVQVPRDQFFEISSFQGPKHRSIHGRRRTKRSSAIDIYGCDRRMM